jgi:predicted DNA-binding transcriptional regulator AlpA
MDYDFLFYRFADLKAMNLVTCREQLMRLQRNERFPKPIKINKRDARFPKKEVDDWIKGRFRLRDGE